MKQLSLKGNPLALLLFLLLAMLLWIAVAVRDALFSPFQPAFTNYTYYGGGSKINSTSRGLRAGPEGIGIIDAVVDFALISAQRTADGQAALAQNDTLDVIAFGAGTVIEWVAAKLVTVEGAAATIGVGDSGGATQYLTAFDANSAANYLLSASTTRKLYTANDAIRLTLNSANGYTKSRLHIIAKFSDLTTYKTGL